MAEIDELEVGVPEEVHEHCLPLHILRGGEERGNGWDDHWTRFKNSSNNHWTQFKNSSNNRWTELKNSCALQGRRLVRVFKKTNQENLKFEVAYIGEEDQSLVLITIVPSRIGRSPSFYTNFLLKMHIILFNLLGFISLVMDLVSKKYYPGPSKITTISMTLIFVGMDVVLYLFHILIKPHKHTPRPNERSNGWLSVLEQRVNITDKLECLTLLSHVILVAFSFLVALSKLHNLEKSDYEIIVAWVALGSSGVRLAIGMCKFMYLVYKTPRNPSRAALVAAYRDLRESGQRVEEVIEEGRKNLGDDAQNLAEFNELNVALMAEVNRLIPGRGGIGQFVSENSTDLAE